jgi:periplasmic copper chaperone A
MKKTPVRILMIAFASVSFLGLAACGSGSESNETRPTIEVRRQWARSSPAATTIGAAYMTLQSDVDDELVEASVQKSVAMLTEVHEIVMVDGAMKMQQVSSVPVVAGTATELKPGGYHIMLMQLAKPLKTGESFQVTLSFAKAGDVVVEVPIMEDAP